mmetsp:Transcript_98753/g.282297  ORF Transcript_98753/g.282297 Transcript_98753/m.282297 type:complete len:326 (+) Transcript_98753:865-1842(+)
MKSLRERCGESSKTRGESTVIKAKKMLKVAVDFDDAMYGGPDPDAQVEDSDSEEEPEMARPVLKAVVIADLPAEDLKAGDKVAYSDDTFVKGSAMGRRETVVMEVRPSNKQYPLVLANGAVLNRGEFLRRRATISVDDDGQPNGYEELDDSHKSRPISSFTLVASKVAGDTDAQRLKAAMARTTAEIHEQILAEEGLDLRGKPAEKPKAKSKAAVKINQEAQRKHRHEQGIYSDASAAESSGEEDSEDDEEEGRGIEDEDSEEDDPGSYNYSGTSAQDKKRAKLKSKPKAKASPKGKAKPSPKAKRSPRAKAKPSPKRSPRAKKR